MKKILSLLILCGILFYSCKNDSAEQKTTTPPTPKETPSKGTPTGITTNPNQKFLPEVTINMIQRIQNEATQLDIVFPGKPMSVSQSNKQSILQSVSFFSKVPAPDPIPCDPIGRIFYAADGENLYDVEVYFAQNCTYCVFIEDNKTIGACLMSPQGVNFFNQIVGQGKKMTDQVKQARQGN